MDCNSTSSLVRARLFVHSFVRARSFVRMSSSSSSHLSKSKQDDEPRHVIERHSSSVSPLRDTVVESAYTTQTTTPFEGDEWKTNFPSFSSRCIVPSVTQTSSLLSQIYEDMDTTTWDLASQTIKFEPTLIPAAREVKREDSKYDAKKEAEKEKNRARMRRLRAARDAEKVERDREKARERTRRVRASWSEERRQKERDRAKEYMRKRRAAKAKALMKSP